MLGVCPILGCFGTARAQKQSNDTYGVSDSLVLSRTLLVLFSYSPVLGSKYQNHNSLAA